MTIETSFTNNKKILSETFNSTFLIKNCYLLEIYSDGLLSRILLFRNFNSGIRGSGVYAVTPFSIVIDESGVTLFGDVTNIIKLVVYDIIINN